MKAKIFIFIILTHFGFCYCSPPAIAKGRPQPPKQKAIFFPPEPDDPRLQYLASFSFSDDFEKPPSAFKKFIVGNEKNAKPIVKPYGVVVHKNKIYLCDTVQNSIDILNFETRKFEYFKPQNDAQLIDPISLDFDAADNMYVSDARRGQVLVFDEGANYIGAIGNKSEFKPTGVMVHDDQIFVCDLKSHSVKVYSVKDRSYLRSIPGEGSKDAAKLFSPTNLAADQEGNIYVSDTGGFRIQVYSPQGEFLRSIGGHGDAFGQFARPKGIAVDKEGRIYAVDAAFENVQIFDKEGKLLLFFAEPGGSSVSLILPAGIAIDYSLKDYFSPLISPGFEVEHLILVTNQYGDKKLSVFGFGHKK